MVRTTISAPVTGETRTKLGVGMGACSVVMMMLIGEDGGDHSSADSFSVGRFFFRRRKL